MIIIYCLCFPLKCKLYESRNSCTFNSVIYPKCIEQGLPQHGRHLMNTFEQMNLCLHASVNNDVCFPRKLFFKQQICGYLYTISEKEMTIKDILTLEEFTKMITK